MLVSTAYMYILVCEKYRQSGRSLIYNRKSKGPRIDPCGTLHNLTNFGVDIEEFVWVRLQTICDRNCVFHTIAILLIEYCDWRCWKPLINLEKQWHCWNQDQYSWLNYPLIKREQWSQQLCVISISTEGFLLIHQCNRVLSITLEIHKMMAALIQHSLESNWRGLF